MIGTIFLFPFWYLCVIIASSINTIIFRMTLSQKLRQKLKFDDCFCEYCGKLIKPKRLANLPLINYFILHGYTNCCNKLISVYHPISEFSLGTLIFIIIWMVCW
jgi:prepilin signal peptidase PulO-like enzyme (type II secretory pathway)